ncbi:unnamed protein product [Eruca vesicaria subsp. sativa]|uniref:UBC core domain-containing protein n=1 Tax=Eruca vesicaria subsp. sativa TaxID=29727 RepID=A0ABC8KT85_ERUVS|nr:unnamed protein product [Eruca vesicaria subsp. sativa]
MTHDYIGRVVFDLNQVLKRVPPDSRPLAPPQCKFPPNFFHPNVSIHQEQSCLSILNEDSHFSPSPAITVKQILVGIQDLLDTPKPADPAQTDGYHLFIQDVVEYKKRVKLHKGTNSVDDKPLNLVWSMFT